MSDLREMLDEAVKPIKLKVGEVFKNFLTEEDDFTGDDTGSADPFADVDNTSNDDTDPFANNDDTNASEKSTDDNSSDDDNDSNEKSSITDESHEDDPDFMSGVKNTTDVTLPDTPAGKLIYDTEKVMNTLATVIQSLKDTELVEIEKVKNAIELVFNGKKLKDEDLEFTNLKNAIFLIKKVGVKLDIKTRNYLYRKIKEPLILKRDQIKQDIAVQKGELQNTREVLTAMDVK